MPSLVTSQQPDSLHFTADNFIRECEKRGLRMVRREFLAQLADFDLVRPVAFEGREYYDLYQILQIGFIVKNVECGLIDLEKEREQVKELLLPFQRVLLLLQDLRYFYQENVYGHVSTGIHPPIELSGQHPRLYGIDWFAFYQESVKHFKPTDYFSKHQLEKKTIQEMRDRFMVLGHSIDPMEDWYVFLRTIRTTDNAKFGRVKGDVLLAHDYYIAAELLTLFFKGCFDDTILEPEDIMDGRGGKWKEGECAGCGKKIKKVNFQHRYCDECQANAKAEHYRCENKECKKPLLSFADGNTVFENVSLHRHAKPGKTLKQPIQVSLRYGEMQVFVQCASCGRLNWFSLSKGWF